MVTAVGGKVELHRWDILILCNFKVLAKHSYTFYQTIDRARAIQSYEWFLMLPGLLL